MMSKTTLVLRRKLKASQGFSLLELVVVCLISGVLVAGMLGLYYGVQRSFADTGNRMNNQDDARTAINQAGRYIRMAESSASNLTSTSDAIALASPQEMIFYADVDGDSYSEKVHYYLSGQSLMMDTTHADLTATPPTYPSTPTLKSVVIMNGIVNGTTPIFTYYQLNPTYGSNPSPSYDNLTVISNPTSASDLAKITAVYITLYVNENPVVSKGNIKIDSMFQIRQRYNGGLSGS